MTTQQAELSAQDIWALFKETDLKFKETDLKFKETDRRLKETGRLVKATVKSVADLSSKWGRFVEGLLAPAITRLFKERGIEVEKVYQRVKAKKNGRQMEIDLLALDHDCAVLIEAKSSLSVENVTEHLERLAQFKKYFPEYKEKKAFGAVAGIVIDESADRYAYHRGLFVIAQSGETVKILNDKKFKPKAW